MSVAVWPGHVGKPTPDPGACGPTVCEDDVTGDVAAVFCRALRRVGVAVVDLGAGTYMERAEYADRIGAALVIHVHLDTGKPAIYSYGPSPTAGHFWARHIHAAAADHVPLQLRTAHYDAYPRARQLLGSTRAPAVLLELADVRDPESIQRLRDHLDGLAQDVARTIAAQKL